MLTSEVDELNAQITAAIQAHVPELLNRYGVGPDTAAALLLAAGANPERLTSEASFAALCGVSPIEVLGQDPPTSTQPRWRSAS
jgi:transposase